MKALVVEDEFSSRKILQKFLKSLGEVDVATDGHEAIEAIETSIKDGAPYQLICLDIMIPDISGLEVITKIREIEAANGIHGLDGTKIIMTSARNDKETILSCFKKGCEAYLIKPISKSKLDDQLKNLGFSPSKDSAES